MVTVPQPWKWIGPPGTTDPPRNPPQAVPEVVPHHASTITVRPGALPLAGARPRCLRWGSGRGPVREPLPQPGDILQRRVFAVAGSEGNFTTQWRRRTTARPGRRR